jgi:hypothetical protein
LTLTVNGTDLVCGLESKRLEVSDGSYSNWINGAEGLFMTRIANPDGSNTTFCPPMKMVPAQMYLGMKELNSFQDAIFADSGGSPFGSHDGWSSFTVKGLEDVSVPAGTFTDCLRATFVYSFTETWSGAYGFRTEEAWYARGVGIVKRVSTDIVCSGGTIVALNAETFRLESFAVAE